MVSFNVKLSDKDMYSFYLYHAYTTSQGVISIVFGIIGIMAGILTFGRIEDFYSIAYIVIGILFFIYLPVALKLKSKAAEKLNPVLFNGVDYTVEDKKGISVRVCEEEANLPFDMIYKAVTKKDLLFIFSSRVNAYIIPKRELIKEDEKIKDSLIEILNNNLPAHRVKISWD